MSKNEPKAEVVTNNATTADLPPIQIFLSYARSDDAQFDLIEPLARQLKQIISAVSGRPVNVFIDRQNIPLGTNWQSALHQAVEAAYFFIPVYTANYRNSNMCREEFIGFLESSRSKGVSELIIPIVLFGFETLLPEGEDVISDYIRGHQAVEFQSAWVEGVKSAAYRSRMLTIAQRIVEAVPRVDEALAIVEGVRAGDADAKELHGSEIAEGDGLIEVGDQVVRDLDHLQQYGHALGKAMSDLGNVPSLPTNASSAIMNRYMITVAEKWRNPSQEIAASGQQMFETAQKCDARLRKIVDLANYTGSEQVKSDLYESLIEGVESLLELQNVVVQLDDLLDSMKVPEAMSATIRRSLKPSRRGITAARDTVRLLLGWPALIQDLKEDE